jgi:superfamily II RNA helicase
MQVKGLECATFSAYQAPKNSRFVFLSATVPNAKEFVDWVAKVIFS